MTKPVHVMVDLETFGNGNNAVPVSIGAVKFTADDVIDRFHVGIDPGSCEAVGLKIDASTVMWWLEPEREDARKQLLALDKIELFYALDGFAQWYNETGTELPIWGNGATFDNVILRSAYRSCNMEYPAPFWLDRCYRSMKTLVPGVKLERVGTHHNAVDDAESQARHLIAIWKYLGVEA